GRDLDALDLLRPRAQLGKDRGEAIERRVDRVAAGIEPEIIAVDVPASAEVFRDMVWIEAAPDELAERFLDRLRLRLEAGERQFRGQSGGVAAHAPGDVERRRAGDRIRVAR